MQAWKNYLGVGFFVLVGLFFFFTTYKTALLHLIFMVFGKERNSSVLRERPLLCVSSDASNDTESAVAASIHTRKILHCLFQ